MTTHASRRCAQMATLMLLVFVMYETQPVVHAQGCSHGDWFWVSYSDSPSSCALQNLGTVFSRTITYRVFGVFTCPTFTQNYAVTDRGVVGNGMCGGLIAPDCEPWFNDPIFTDVSGYHRWEAWSHNRDIRLNPNTSSYYCFTYSDTQFLYSIGQRSCTLCPQSCPEPPSPDYCGEGELWNPDICRCQISPIIIDTSGNGYDLTNPDQGTQFRFSPTSRIVEASWTAARSDESFLVLDRNGNGTIDDGSELFGSTTPMPDGTRSANGFVALAGLEQDPAFGPSHVDGVIDARDAVYAQLRLWTDRNHNGISEPDELRALSDVGLLSIDTDAKPSGRRDEHGNRFALAAKSRWRVGNGAVSTRFVFDVWLTTQPLPGSSAAKRQGPAQCDLPTRTRSAN